MDRSDAGQDAGQNAGQGGSTMSLDEIVNSPQARALISRLAAQLANEMTICPKGDQGELGTPGAPGGTRNSCGSSSPSETQS